jgi:hypothetical protein
MGRYKCPQCGRGFGSVGEMLDHTEKVHAAEAPYRGSGSGAIAPARGMPSAEPGPVATERARRTEFDLEAAGGDGGGLIRPGSGEADGEGSPETQNTALGTIIALLVIAALIILNLLAGGE